MAKTWIKLRTIAAGPDFAGKPGQVLEVDSKAAEALIEGKFAEKSSAPSDPEPPLTAEEIAELREIKARLGKEKATAPDKKEKATAPDKG